MKVTLAQLNPTVGDIEGNTEKLITTLEEYGNDTDLVVFSELFLVGYPPKDLLDRDWFINGCQKAIKHIEEVSKKYPKTGIVFGAPLPSGKNVGKGIYNSAILVYQGQVQFIQNKSLLPTYDVFDEARYFDPAESIEVYKFKGEKLGISVCEDAWNGSDLWPRFYHNDPIKTLAQKGATLFINISASPFNKGKEELRYNIIQSHAGKYRNPFIFVNQIGGNDELIFDGKSMYFDKSGEPVLVAPGFKEHIKTVDISARGKSGAHTLQNEIESVYEALVLGIKDYISKVGFSQALLGLSGGIDSALVCCLATEAIGGKNVLGITMPSPYSSKGSVEDSRQLANNLGVSFKEISIKNVYQSYLDIFKREFAGKEMDATEENIQARIRGNILMAYSNKYGYLLLSTGNKSELAVGYCTLYGDMSGGLSVISDVPKTLVYELARYINRDKEVIPNSIIEKAPSAELKPGQLDQDTLPPYCILDKILQSYIEDLLSVEEIINLGYDSEIVKWVVRAVEKNEYKRKQAALGLKVTSKAFGMGRRMPIAAKFRWE